MPGHIPEKTIEPSTTAYPNLSDRTFITLYDSGGLATANRQPGGTTVTATYNEMGRLTAQSGSGGGAASATRTLTRDLGGLVTSVNLPSAAINFTYDDRRLLTQSTGGAGTANYTYDSVGRMTQRTDPAGTQNFTYTQRSELASASDPLNSVTHNFTWDAASQLTQIQYGSGSVPKHTLVLDLS